MTRRPRARWRLPRRTAPRQPAAAGPRAAHDVIVATAAATARGTIGRGHLPGRLIRIGVLEIPALPPSAHSPCAGRRRADRRVRRRWRRARPWWAWPRRTGRPAGSRSAPRDGVVKRVAPDYPANATEFEVISLKEGDRVVGAVQLAGDDADLVFITSDAQLLRFRAAAVRPQGRAAGGMAGIRLSAGAAVIWFGAVRQRAGRPRTRRRTR